MNGSKTTSLRLQLEEAIQMLRLVANEERTCVEVREWLDQNYPDDADADSQSIVNLLLKSKPDIND